MVFLLGRNTLRTYPYERKLYQKTIEIQTIMRYNLNMSPIELSRSDRRRYNRRPTHLPLRYQLKGSMQYADTLTKDIGGGGVKFITDEFLSKNSEVIFEISIMDRSEPVKGRAKIVWINKVPHNDIYSIGLEFVDISRDKKRKIIHFADSRPHPPA